MHLLEVQQKKGFWKTWTEVETLEDAGFAAKDFFYSYPADGVMAKVMHVEHMKLDGQILTDKMLHEEPRFESIYAEERAAQKEREEAFKKHKSEVETMLKTLQEERKKVEKAEKEEAEKDESK